MNIKELEQDPNLLQVWNNNHYGNWLDKDFYADPDTLWGCFSFYPTVNRMNLYRKLPGGYKALTKNISYGQNDAGKA